MFVVAGFVFLLLKSVPTCGLVLRRAHHRQRIRKARTYSTDGPAKRSPCLPPNLLRLVLFAISHITSYPPLRAVAVALASLPAPGRN
ncbi:hypothetical protein EV126DRAFT_416161 [Verticillium dahliae]|nr:hypothetical protein EV126DRAFT_416161 [Verticillium dahliae]